jgi:beta-phosphoglucomutase-like phosphatase (HAD superfamily)
MSATPAYALIAFDLDNTLVDSESITIPNLLEQLAADYNLHLTAKAWLARYHGMAGQALINQMNADHNLSIDYADFAMRRKARIETLLRTNGLMAAPGMLQMLRRVVGTGQQVALVSNSNPARIMLSLEVTQGQRQHGLVLAHLFEGHIFSGTDPTCPARQSKPAPDVYLAAATYYGQPPKRCLAVEDSVTGVAAAVAAGFTCWGYTGLTPDADAAAQLTAAGASHIFTHWDEFKPS